MQFIPVESSILESVSYDLGTLVLVIAFRNGTVYQYDGVREGIYWDLIQARSKGKFFHEFILGVYDAKRVS